jgi:hypothetical protein
MGACGSKEGEAAVSEGIGVGIEADKYNANLEKQLVKEHQKESSKVKLLLLGAGESGKSTIFKQMRILYGTPRTDDELRMFGVIIRSNIIAFVKQLLFLLKRLDMEAALEEESKAMKYEGGPMTLLEAYNELLEFCSGETNALVVPQDGGVVESESLLEKDWVGRSSQAGPAANEDARLFLRHWKAIRTFWQVNSVRRLEKSILLDVSMSFHTYPFCFLFFCFSCFALSFCHPCFSLKLLNHFGLSVPWQMLLMDTKISCRILLE